MPSDTAALTDADVREAVADLQQLPPVADATGSASLKEITVYLTTFESDTLAPVCDAHNLQFSAVTRRDADAEPTPPDPVEVLLEFTPDPVDQSPRLSVDAITRALGEFAAHPAVRGATYTDTDEFHIVAETETSDAFDDICGWFGLTLTAFSAQSPSRGDCTAYRFAYTGAYEPYDHETITRLKRRQALLEKFHAAAPRTCQRCGGDLTPQTVLVSGALLPDAYGSQLADRIAEMVLVFDDVDADGLIVDHPNAAGDGGSGVIERGWQCDTCSRTILWPNLATWLVETFDSPADYDPQQQPETIQPSEADRP